MQIKSENEQEYLIVLESEKIHQEFPKPIIEVKKEENNKLEAPKVQLKVEFIPRKPKIKCKYCPKSFKTKGRYYNHLDVHKIDGKLPKPESTQKSIQNSTKAQKIENCSTISSKLQTIINNNTNNTSTVVLEPPTSQQHQRNFSCDLCGNKYRTKIRVSAHIKAVHLFSSECKICNKKLSYGSSKSHMMVHITEKNFQCKVCEKMFKTPNDLKYHMRMHNKKFDCGICGKKFARKKSKIEHEKVHQQKDFKVYECKLCGLKFMTMNHLTRHQRNHKEKSQKSLKCSKCNYSTDYKQYFNIHQKSHEYKDKKAADIKNPIKCVKCPAVLRNKQALRCHMINCHPIAPYECDLCGRVINARTNFIKHINYHLSMRKLQDD